MIRLPTEVKRLSSSHELSIVPGILPLAIASDMAACHMIVDYIDPTLISNHLTYRTYQMEHAAGQGGRCSGHMPGCLNSRSVCSCQHQIRRWRRLQYNGARDRRRVVAKRSAIH